MDKQAITRGTVFIPTDALELNLKIQWQSMIELDIRNTPLRI